MKFCVIGAGRMGSLHAANIAVSDRAELAYIVDSDKSRAETLARRYGTLAVTSTDEPLSNPDIKAVVIASATDTHADLIEASVKADKAIFCEKPIDLSLERVKACEHTINGFSLPVMIGFHRRFDETHKAVRQAIETGEIGFVESINIISRNSSPPSYDYIKTSGGQFLDQMIHDFDLTRFYLDKDEPFKLVASASNISDKKFNKIKDYELATCLINSKNGVQCVITNSRHCTFGYDQRVELFGSKGMLISNNKREQEASLYSNNYTSSKSPFMNFFIERYKEAYKLQLNDLKMFITNNIKPLAQFEEGRKALIMANAAVKSLKSKKFEKLAL